MAQSAIAIRGVLLHLIGDPFCQPITDCVRFWVDGLLVVEAGRIVAAGDYDELRSRYTNVPVTHYPDKLIVPGLIDTHVHFPQTEMIASYGEQLLSWLERYTFPTEQKFSDRAYSLSVANHFLDELLRHGTTTALVFTTVYPQSTDAFFAAAQSRNLRMIAGKVLMDRHAPEALLDTPERAYQESKALIEKWHGTDRLLYAVTPRFAITSTPAQLQAAGQLLKEFSGVYMHTHLSENLDEMAWTAELFPGSAHYLDVYEQAGLVGKRSVFAHGVHLSAAEWQQLSACDCAIAHCPTSNTFLGSGLFSLQSAKKRDRPVKVGLGTDVGGGTNFSLLRTGGEAYKVAQLRKEAITPFQALFLATLGGAQALCLEHVLGNFALGKEADFVVLDPLATPTLAFRNRERVAALAKGAKRAVLLDKQIEWLRSLVFSLLILADDRTVHATYIMGEKVEV